jgi:hypothetical protein
LNNLENFSSARRKICQFRTCVTECLCHGWPRICSVCRNHNMVLSLFITYHNLCNNSSTTEATCRAGTSILFHALLYQWTSTMCWPSTKQTWETLSRNESRRFGALKSDSTHHFFRNDCTKSGSLRFSQFSGCWLILSVYILMSFDFPFVRLFGVR